VAKSLVIVESPAKARTIAAFLGKDYMVESSIGHIRDLPKSAREIPASYKGKPWARLGVDVDNDFRPLYVLDAGKKTQIQKLKKLMDKADEVLLATDEDREGESIAWHLFEVLKPKVPVKRMVFTRSRAKPSRAPSTILAASIRTWSTRRKRGAFSIASTATRSRPCCGRR